jgi:ferredoxin--NADP+ reductase
MSYVVTRSCCADASCVVACPVNCIHPAPGEPGFAEAEMVFIDANSCVGCGACVTACPVGAIVPDTALAPQDRVFVDLAAEYFEVFPHADRRPLAPVPTQRRLRHPGPFRVAVVGAGPAGLYAADELLRHPEISVDVYDRMSAPYGLARFGVAPDHPETRAIQHLFAAIEDDARFRYALNVEIGRDLALADLRARYDAVIYAVGAASDRRLDVPGEDLPGSLSSTDVVGWYNGHPAHADLGVPLDTERVVVIGSGNVALDVARMLTRDADTLRRTDMPALPREALAGSTVREVVVLGRRGAEFAAFTTPELVALAARDDIDVLLKGSPPPGDSVRSRLLGDLARRDPGHDPLGSRPRIVLRFDSIVDRIIGSERVAGVRLTDGTEIAAGLVVRAIGYRGLPVPDLPYDAGSGTVPHRGGRVEPGLYVAGWVKRGPTGFIGTNKTCAQETVAALLDDLDEGAHRVPERGYAGRRPRNPLAAATT